MERIGLAPGTEVGGYTIVAPLGSGGMGAVYRAVDGGGAAVALKLLHPHVGADPAARERLRREVRALQRLRHPGIAQVLDAETDAGEAFLVTELLEGPDLSARVREHGPLAPAPLLALAAGLRGTLRAVHAAGVVHRDLKPANVLVTDDGPVLIDFGIAHAGEAPLTSTGMVIGTPGYLAPELVDGAEPSPATDWWGWAALLAWAATGRPPFGGGSADVVVARARSGEPDLTGVGPRTAEALRGALDPDPARRWDPERVMAALVAAAEDGDPQPEAEATQVVDADATQRVAWPAIADPAPPTAIAATTVLPAGGPVPGAAGAGAQDGATRAFAAGAAGDLDDDPDDLGDLDDAAGWHPDARDPGGAPAWGEVADWEDAGEDPGDPDPDYPDAGHDGDLGPVSPVPPARAGTLLALAAVVVAGAATHPGWTLVALAAAVWLARTVGSASEAMHERRARVGVRRGDVARAWGAAPWHLLRALVGMLPALVVGASGAVIVGGVGWWAVDTGALLEWPAAPDGAPAGWLWPAVLAAAAAVGLLLTWWGPASRLTRVGARRTLAAVAPGTGGATVLVLLALAGVVLLGAGVLAGDAPVWAPLPGPPPL